MYVFYMKEKNVEVFSPLFPLPFVMKSETRQKEEQKRKKIKQSKCFTFHTSLLVIGMFDTKSFVCA